MPDISETQLEKTFADLAHARLQDRSPALLDYLVGFQLIKQEDDGARAVGMFGFDVAGRWYFAPIFYLNGEVKGPEMLYSADEDLFLPLTEDQVDQITNRKPVQLGSVEQGSRSSLGIRMPEFGRFQSDLASFGRKQASAATAFDVAQRRMCVIPEYANCVDAATGIRMLGKAAAADWLQQLDSDPDFANAFGQFYDRVDLLGVDTLPSKKASVRVKIITSPEDPDAAKLDDPTKVDLLHTGVAVIDERDDSEKSTVYQIDGPRVIKTVTEPGLYTLLMAGGAAEEFYVLRCPLAHSVRTAPMVLHADSNRTNAVALLAIRKSDKKYIAARSGQLYIGESGPNDKFSDFVEASGVSTVRAGDVVVFVSGQGECMPPLCVESVTIDGDRTVVRGQVDGWCYGCGTVTFSPKGSKHIKAVGNEAHLSDDTFAAVKIGKGRRFEGSDGWDPMFYDKSLRSSDLPSQSTVSDYLFKHASDQIKLWSGGTEVNVADSHGRKAMGKVAALSYLIKQHGIGADEAHHMLKEASARPVRYFVKHAAVNFPSFPDLQDETQGLMGAFHREQFPVDQFESAGNDYAANSQAFEYQSPFAAGGDPKQELQTAAQTGQKEVFDAAVFGSLVKTHTPVDQVRKFLPTIISGMDRVGRTMFLLNWHFEEFEEQYGKQDLAELEDNLRAVFENLGELVVFLRQRTLSGDADFFNLSGESPLG